MALEIDPHSGWLLAARRVPSPNQDARPPGCAIDLVVVHGISLPAGCYGGPHVEALFTNTLDCTADPALAPLEGLRVSAHALIRRGGEVVQFVPFPARAWHAGESRHEGRTACNDFSIGIELEGSDADPYTPVQYDRLAALCAGLMAHWPAITPARIVGHSHVAPGRKSDPGPAFDWDRFHACLARARAGEAVHEGGVLAS